MKGYTSVKINNYELLDMLTERVEHWVKDYDEVRLYSQMYEDMIDGGVFEGMELDIPVIVDNDCINYCSIICKEDVDADEWERLEAIYKSGQRDISCENFSGISGSFVEVMSDEMALLRA